VVRGMGNGEVGTHIGLLECIWGKLTILGCRHASKGVGLHKSSSHVFQVPNY
jgi:hypothetical protein